MSGRPPLPDDIKALMKLVRTGKLFDVQKWIAEGKRTVPPEPYWFSPLRVAIETGFHSMVEVLLQAGIDQKEKNYLLYQALWRGNFDLIKLFVDYGADPLAVEFDDACGTGNPEIMRFFADHGIDVITGHPFARALCHPKRPQLGIYMQYRDKIPELKHQVNLALRHHAKSGGMKWVCLLLWAGGDAHVKLPDIDNDPDPESDTSALEEAIYNNHDAIVAKIGIDPEKDDLNGLLEKACSAGNWKVIEKLIDLGANINAKSEYGAMDRLIWNFKWKINPIFGFRSETEMEEALANITRFAAKGGRWEPNNKYGLNGLRRELYRLDAGWIEKIVREFLKNNVCSKTLLLGLISTPKMKQLLGERFHKMKALLAN